MIKNQNERFALVLMAHQEKAVIKRCLESVVNLVDEYLIQAQDESDEMIPIIKEVLQGKPYEIIFYPWQNFAANRSHLLLQARARLTADFFLLLDAKEAFVCPDKRPITEKTKLKVIEELNQQPWADVFFLQNINKDFRNSRKQVLRNNQIYYYKFAFHEQLQSTRSVRSGVVNSIVGYTRCDGASGMNKQKYKGYVNGLKKELAENSQDPEVVDHCTFYIGQSYCDYGNSKKGVIWYRKYAEMYPDSGYGYIARCRTAWIEEQNANYEEAEKLYLLSIQKQPSNPKAYYELARMYTFLHRHEEAVDTLEEALLKRKDTQVALFEDTSIVGWRIRYLLAKNYLVLEKQEKAFSLFKQLLEEGILPTDKIEEVEDHLA